MEMVKGAFTSFISIRSLDCSRCFSERFDEEDLAVDSEWGTEGGGLCLDGVDSS